MLPPRLQTEKRAPSSLSLTRLFSVLQVCRLAFVQCSLAYSLCCRACARRSRAAHSTGYEPRALSSLLTKFSRSSSLCFTAFAPFASAYPLCSFPRLYRLPRATFAPAPVQGGAPRRRVNFPRVGFPSKSAVPELFRVSPRLLRFLPRISRASSPYRARSSAARRPPSLASCLSSSAASIALLAVVPAVLIVSQSRLLCSPSRVALSPPLPFAFSSLPRHVLLQHRCPSL